MDKFLMYKLVCNNSKLRKTLQLLKWGLSGSFSWIWLLPKSVFTWQSNLSKSFPLAPPALCAQSLGGQPEQQHKTHVFSDLGTTPIISLMRLKDLRSFSPSNTSTFGWCYSTEAFLPKCCPYRASLGNFTVRRNPLPHLLGGDNDILISHLKAWCRLWSCNFTSCLMWKQSKKKFHSTHLWLLHLEGIELVSERALTSTLGGSDPCLCQWDAHAISHWFYWHF